MRLSCNGCRVLRKGCSEDCCLRPCLQWLNSPESEANATLFLAKFYGRAGLINLINAAPSHLRPEIFRSLLYEACGRIINPVYGSVGLLSSGDWPRCQAAVEAVLGGGHVAPDIRHISKETAASYQPRNSRKRSASRADSVANELFLESEEKFTITGWDEEAMRALSRDSPILEPRLGEIGLELTLGFNPMLRTYVSTVIQISDHMHTQE